MDISPTLLSTRSHRAKSRTGHQVTHPGSRLMETRFQRLIMKSNSEMTVHLQASAMQRQAGNGSRVVSTSCTSIRIHRVCMTLGISSRTMMKSSMSSLWRNRFPSTRRIAYQQNSQLFLRHLTARAHGDSSSGCSQPLSGIQY